MATNELKRQSGGPMYQQLRQELLAKIRRGEFAPGSVLPSENQLCEQYGVSVTTARRAFLELVKEGVVWRKVGLGTVVASEVRRARIALVSIDYVGDAWRHVSSVMGEMIAGVGEYVWQNNAILNMVGVEDSEAATYLRGLAEERSVDGVLLRVANDIREEHLEILEEAGLPYVVVKRHIPGRRMNCVISDDVVGARIATSYLLDLGYRRIAFVCAKPQITLARERLIGYREALADCGVDYDETLVRQESYFTVERGQDAVRSLMELPEPPEAIFVASDTMAMGGYGAAQELNLKIPEDLALVGYDDIPPASVLQPPLTTIRTSYYDFGHLASQLLLELIDGKELAPQQRIIEPSLVVRGSAEKGEVSTTVTADHSIGRELPDESGSPTSISSGCLAGKLVLSAGPQARVRRTVAGICEAQGAQIVFDDHQHAIWERVGGERDHAEVIIYSLSLQQNFSAVLRQALEYGRSAVEDISERGSGRLLYVCTLPESTADGVELEAARAGLAKVVDTLAELGAEKVGVNALLTTQELTEAKALEDRGVAGPMVFLVSDDASSVSGETLVLGSQGGR